jgi:hypothetical protein
MGRVLGGGGGRGDETAPWWDDMARENKRAVSCRVVSASASLGFSRGFTFVWDFHDG